MHERGEAVALVSVHGRARASGGCARLAGAAGAGKSNESENEVCDCCEFFHAPGLSNGRAILVFPGIGNGSAGIERQNWDKAVPNLACSAVNRELSFLSPVGQLDEGRNMSPGLPSGVSASERIEQILSAFERRSWSPNTR